MIILDEDLSSEAVRQAVGAWWHGTVLTWDDVGRRGTSDEQILVELREHRNCVFVTGNTRHFWQSAAGDRRYCIVCLDGIGNEPAAVSELLRNVLRSPPFTKCRERNGLVARATPDSLRYYRNTHGCVEVTPFPPQGRHSK